jgi:hypothetical protein
MDFVNKFANSEGEQGQGQQQENREGREGQNEQKKEGGGFFGSIGDKLNSAAGGGKESEKNEDYLDKGSFLLSLYQIFPAGLPLWDFPIQTYTFAYGIELTRYGI